MSRRKAREKAFKILFVVDLVQVDAKEALLELNQDLSVREDSKEFISNLVSGTLDHLEKIDQNIIKFSPDWPLDRMPTVDRNLLRMAAYEILFANEVHPVVAINEAIELAKIYGDENSPAFINAILDRVKGDKP